MKNRDYYTEANHLAWNRAMSYPYVGNTYVGWDFEDIWTADIDYEINDGYPYLLWQELIISPLDPPQNVTVSISDNNVIITWDGVEGATSYRIEASNDPYAEYVDITEEGILDGTSWTDAVNEQMIFYRVIATIENISRGE